MGVDTELIIEVKRKGRWRYANYYPEKPILLKRHSFASNHLLYSELEDIFTKHNWDNLPDDLANETRECMSILAQTPIYIFKSEKLRLIWWFG